MTFDKAALFCYEKSGPLGQDFYGISPALRELEFFGSALGFCA